MKHFRTISNLGVRPEQLTFVCPSCKGVDTKEVKRGGVGVAQSAPRQLNKSRVATKRCLFRIEDLMRIHVGCELSFEFPQTTPMIMF